MRVKVCDQIYQIDADALRTVADLSVALCQTGVPIQALTTIVDGEEEHSSSNITYKSQLCEFKNIPTYNFENYPSGSLNVPPGWYNQQRGEDSVGFWNLICERLIVNFTHGQSVNSSWIKLLERDMLSKHNMFNSALKNTNTCMDLGIYFYPEHLFFTVNTRGADKNSRVSSKPCFSLTEAYKQFDLAMDRICSTNHFLPVAELKFSEFSKYYHLTKSPVGCFNFSQLFIISKNHQNIDFWLWDPISKNKTKSDLKFKGFTEIFKYSPDFVIKANINGNCMSIYDLLQLGEKNLANCYMPERLNLLKILVDNWDIDLDYEFIVEDFLEDKHVPV